MIMADQTRAPGKHRFIFSNAAGRAWEARQNAEDARAILRRLAPDASTEPPSADPALSGSSGGAFRRVMAILQKKRGWK